MSPSQTDQLLRSLDSADASIDPAVVARVDAELERIVSRNPLGSPARSATARQNARTGHTLLRPRRISLLAGAATVLTGVAIALPGLGGDAPAYASWTATPSTPSVQDTETAVSACRSELEKNVDVTSPASQAAAWTAVAERRGDYVSVLLSDAALDLSGFCVYEQQTGAAAVDGAPITSGVTQGGIAPPDSKSLVEGAISQSGEGDLSRSMVMGRVGSEVIAVTLRSQGDTVTATVRDGQYVAWWPGRVFPAGPASPGSDPGAALAYDLTLTDGTVLSDVEPYTPAGEIVTETATA